MTQTGQVTVSRRHVEHVMGTVFSIDLRTPDVPGSALDEVVRFWHWVDEVFSTYREDSQISRLGRGELAVQECAAEVGEVLAMCADAQRLTDGYFSAVPAGSLDPSGLVKGWSIERASASLAAAGSSSHAINGGGDVRCVGHASADSPWRIGIGDPFRPGQVVATVSGTDFAVATSGVAERGCHVVDPHTGRPARGLASVTLVGNDLTLVDAYATAALAMGDRCRSWIEGLDGYEALVIDTAGREWRSRGWALRTGDSPPRAAS